MKRDIYSGRLKLYGEEHRKTLLAANNHAATLLDLNRLQKQVADAQNDARGAARPRREP